MKMSGKRLPFMPFYVEDFLNDERVETASLEVIGAYVLLLCRAWMPQYSGYLPNDPKLLARWCHCSPPKWRAISDSVTGLFSRSLDNRYLYQKRQVQELEAAEGRRQHAISAAADRWQASDKTETDPKSSINRASIEHAVEHHVEHQSSMPFGDAQTMQSEISEVRSQKLPPFIPPSQGGVPLTLSANAADKPKRRKPAKGSHPQAAEILEALNAARKRVIPGARTLRPLEANLEHISARLSDGNTVEDCLHVIAVREAEAKAKPDSRQWFNQVTPFIAMNFARTLADTPERAGAISAYPHPSKSNGGAAGGLLAPVKAGRPSFEQVQREAEERRARRNAQFAETNSGESNDAGTVNHDGASRPTS
jgi:uncharacterized protein YdaU (DUF1376 family)